MDNITIIEESGGAPQKRGSRWLVTLARPGQGSQGYYPEDVLKATGPEAFPPGTKAFFNHDAKRDVRDMVGTYDDGAFWNEEEGELQAYLTPFPRYADVLDQAGKNVEASIHAASRKDRKGNVTALVAHRANTVDLVSFAGLEGSGLKMQVESLFAAAAADSEEYEEENIMAEITKEEFNALVGALTAFAGKFDTFVAESKLEVKGVADEAAVLAEVESRVEEALSSIAEVEKSINDADLPAVVKESLKAAARKGEDITETLAGAIEIVAEAKKEFKPETPKGSSRAKVVVVDESLDSKPKSNFKIKQWSN